MFYEYNNIIMLYLVIINSLAFIVYGVLCIITNHMVDEFTRYGLLKYRLLTGYLEVLGGLGCLIGYFTHPYLFLFSTTGLTVLMTLGVITRFRVSDPIYQIIPAFLLMCLNAYFVYSRISS